MNEDIILKCVIAFVLGFLVHRMMRGDGLSVGAQGTDCDLNSDCTCMGSVHRDIFPGECKEGDCTCPSGSTLIGVHGAR